MTGGLGPARREGPPAPPDTGPARTGPSVNLKTVIALAFLLIVLLFGSGLAWLNTRAALDLLHRQVGHQFDILARGLSTHVTMQLGSAESVLDTLSMNPPSLSDPEHAGLTMVHLLADLRQISPAVRSLSSTMDDGRYAVAEHVAADADGVAYRLRIGQQGSGPGGEVIDLDQRFAVLLRTAVGAGSAGEERPDSGTVEDNARGSSAQHPSMRRDGDGLTLSQRAQGEPGQVFEVAVQLRALTALLEQARVFEGEHISVFDAQGALLADSSGLELSGRLGTMAAAASGVDARRKDALAFDQQSFAAFITAQAPHEGMFRLPGGDVYASVRPFDVGGRTLVVASSVPTTLFEGAANRLLLRSLMVEVGMLIVAGTMVALASRSISRPIDRLASDVERIIAFEFGARAPRGSRIHEIQRLLAATRTLELTLKAFSTYLPQRFVREFVERGHAPTLGGVRAPVVIMFSDIDGFTSVAEAMLPDDLMLQLSRYFAVIEEEVSASGGTVDKFIGDGVMAFWSSSDREAAQIGTAACRAVLRAASRIAALNRCFAEEGRPTFTTRFGLHAGEALVGNVGTTSRMNYTVLGHAVNIGARIEQLNKLYGSQILASAAVRGMADASIRFRHVTAATIRGSQTPIDVFEMLQGDILLTTDAPDRASTGPEGPGTQHPASATS